MAAETRASVVVEGPGGALHEIGLAHGRTLAGAIDAHIGNLHHNRPWLAAEREDVLEALADAWEDEGGPNWLPSLDPGWVDRRLAGLPPTERDREEAALRDLLAWARAQGVLRAPDAPEAA